MENVSNAVSVIRPLVRPVPPLRAVHAAPPGAVVPTHIQNASGVAGLHSADLTAADIVTALYERIVKQGDLSSIDADLDTLSQVMAASVGFGDAEDDRRAPNIQLGKALNILCQLVRRSAALPCEGERLVRTTQRCVEVVRARQEYTLENVSVIMFHLGELINHPPLQARCAATISEHLAPIFEALLRQHPIHAIGGATLAFGLVSALRASEQQLVRRIGAPLARPAADSLLLTVPALLEAQPDLLLGWESRTLALVAKYGVQYLRRLAQLSRGSGRFAQSNALQINAARALKPIIEEARLPSRGIWDQRDGEYRGMGQDKQLRDYLAYATHYYCRWLAQQKDWVRTRLALREAPRGPLAGSPTDGRSFANVVLRGSALAEASEAAAVTPPPFLATSVRRPLTTEITHLEPPSALARFSQAAGELVRLGDEGDRFDREAAIAACNALIASIASGRTRLSATSRVQMLLDMDAVCMRLYAADPWDAPQYQWQLSSMRGFMTTQLALLVDAKGRPLLGWDVPSATGLFSWQRTLLLELTDHAEKSAAS
ncbi:hypothetical protein [Stenotrophomonas rhizophila]|uniref:hypothetical protein n=1 Tax=Stenotrophomonas rhizophila TaxID=216778 RepID=UPI0011A3263E|nr:hypothetical protein [Stenotrophomonas rhizophila]